VSTTGNGTLQEGLEMTDGNYLVNSVLKPGSESISECDNDDSDNSEYKGELLLLMM
jgi:hypothetical protein